MSFGDDSGSSQGPISGFIGKAISRFDAVLGPAFGYKAANKAPDAAPPPSLVNKPVSMDTPGRHKSLLGGS